MHSVLALKARNSTLFGDEQRGREGGGVNLTQFCPYVSAFLNKKTTGTFFNTKRVDICQISADSEQLGKSLRNSHLGPACMELLNLSSRKPEVLYHKRMYIWCNLYVWLTTSNCKKRKLHNYVENVKYSRKIFAYIALAENVQLENLPSSNTHRVILSVCKMLKIDTPPVICHTTTAGRDSSNCFVVQYYRSSSQPEKTKQWVKHFGNGWPRYKDQEIAK